MHKIEALLHAPTALRKAVSVMAASAIALSGVCVTGGGASQALASTAETAVYLQIDNDKIIASAPTRIDLVVNADGTLTAPDPSSVKLANESAFAIHVSQIEYEAQGGWSYSATPTGAQNEVDLSVTPGAGSDVYQADETKTIESADWNMAGKNAADSSIELSCAGEVRNITKDLGQPQQIGMINWAFAAGALDGTSVEVTPEILAAQYQAAYDAAPEKGEFSNEVIWWVDSNDALTIAPKNGASGTFSGNNATGIPKTIKTAAAKPGITVMGTMNDTFSDCEELADASGLSNLNVSNVTEMYNIFYNCKSLTSIEFVSDWDVSGIDDLTGLFSGCTALKSLKGLEKWDVSSLTNLDSMFRGFDQLTDISALANWNVENVTSMYGTFDGCTALADLSPLANWDVGNVTSFEDLFSNCPSIKDLSPLANWDVGSVENMAGLFSWTTLSSLRGLERWDVGSVTDMSSMFWYAKSLTDISALANWNVENVDNFACMFAECDAIADLSPTAGWNVTCSKNGMSDMFATCPGTPPSWYLW